MSIIIIIPARKSSKRLKDKNILKINGVSLINRALNISKKVKFTNKIILTSDILKIKFKLDDSRFLFIKRPEYLATDTSKVYKTILFIAKYLKKNTNIKFDSVLMLQPTSPFRSLKFINEAHKIYKKHNKLYSVVSFREGLNESQRVFNIKKNKVYLENKKNNKIKTKRFSANGNFYFASIKFIKKNKSFISEKKTIPIVFKSKKLSIDIDNRKDYLLAKRKS